MFKKRSFIILSCLTFLAVALTLFFFFERRETSGKAKKNAIHYRFKAIAAYKKKDYSAYLRNLKEAEKLAPNDPRITYALARAFALNGRKKEAVESLDRTVQMGYYIDPKQAGDFDSIKNSEGYKRVLSKHETIRIPVTTSQMFLSIPEKDLMPEGISYDPITETFYLGSIYKRKIVSITKDRTIRDFTSEKQDGLLSVSALDVDPKRRILWVNTSPYYKMRDFDANNYGYTYVFKYDLDRGRLLRKYYLDERPTLHLFNSLVIASQGDVFLTDSLFGAVYRIAQHSGDLELFIKPDKFTFPNGIAISQDDRYLFVSHVEGISAVDIRTKSYSLLSPPNGMALSGIDGLEFYENSLIAIQDDNWQGRVMQVLLEQQEDRSIHRDIAGLFDKFFFSTSKPELNIKKIRILEVGNPLFSFPTNGVIVNDYFYYIANSQLNCFKEDGSIFPMDQLQDVLIFRVKL